MYAGKAKALVLGAAAIGLLASGCVPHISPYTPKRRIYDLPVKPTKLSATHATGSLWTETAPASYWVADLRAARPNDVLTIEIDEVSSASNNASTTLERESELSASVDALAGLLSALRGPGASPELIKAKTVNDFDGSGTTTRSGRVQATVPGMVRNVLPNGHLFVEGHRVVLINREEHHFYISGVVRPQDIDTKNIVRSSRMADAQIEFTGRGVVSEKNGPGWLSRLLDWVWPL